MQKIDLRNLDKSKWKTYRFDHIVKNISERVEPSETDLETYIGLEHIDAESIHIKRFGQPTDVEGQKLKCYPGDVIFGKRRAYQRKASVVTTEAICSAHAFVLRANPEVIEPKLLPFFLHSDLFMHRAVDISAGGLSPTINWGVLKIQGFLLPPKEQQAELAELLWAMDEVIEKDLEVLGKLGIIIHKGSEVSFTKGNNSAETKDFFSFKIPKHWSVMKMSDVASVEYGISESVANNTDPNIGWQIITGANINLDGTLDLSKKRYIEIPEKDRFFLKKGDLLFNWRSGSPEHIGKTAIVDLDGNYTYASFVLRIRCGKFLNNKFAYYLLNYLRKIEFFTKNIAQQVNFKINATVFREIEIPVPPIDEQITISDKLEMLGEVSADAFSKIAASKALLKSLINEVF